MKPDELLKYLIREANKLGLKGTEVVDWIPPQDATQDYRGCFVTLPARLIKDGSS